MQLIQFLIDETQLNETFKQLSGYNIKYSNLISIMINTFAFSTRMSYNAESYFNIQNFIKFGLVIKNLMQIVYKIWDFIRSIFYREHIKLMNDNQQIYKNLIEYNHYHDEFKLIKENKIKEILNINETEVGSIEMLIKYKELIEILIESKTNHTDETEKYLGVQFCPIL